MLGVDLTSSLELFTPLLPWKLELLTQATRVDGAQIHSWTLVQLSSLPEAKVLKPDLLESCHTVQRCFPAAASPLRRGTLTRSLAARQPGVSRHANPESRGTPTRISRHANPESRGTPTGSLTARQPGVSRHANPESRGTLTRSLAARQPGVSRHANPESRGTLTRSLAVRKVMRYRLPVFLA
ncbi:hypothetical protein RRG08_033455 [Elysia crispata]|uniref:Uncharacterized protein n=1 Tax=Elysia crispata TaxID=231223 RepID=A0AAE1AU32_9GAST|nr:hypothetical protein RRG08_033455 [Elysia crispata]